MHLGDDVFCPAVPVGIGRKHLLFPFHQDIVHPPGIDGEASDIRIPLPGLPDSLPDVPQQRLDIPYEMSVLFIDSVGKTVNLLCFQLPVLHPSGDMPSGGGSDVDGQVSVHVFLSFRMW